MLASPNTISYTKEAVRFIVLNNILTTAFIDLESIFSDYFVQSSVLQFKCVLSTVRFLGKANLMTKD